METFSLAEAKARLSELVTRAAEGESVQITRRGKPVAQITPIDRPRKPIDIELLRSVTEGMPASIGIGWRFHTSHARRGPLLNLRYVDTSILVAALAKEAHTARAQRWLTTAAPGELAISDWGIAEFSSALSIKMRTGQINGR